MYRIFYKCQFVVLISSISIYRENRIPRYVWYVSYVRRTRQTRRFQIGTGWSCKFFFYGGFVEAIRVGAIELVPGLWIRDGM